MPKKNISKTLGLVPGTLVHIGDKKVDNIRITVIDYDKNHFQEKTVQSAEECFEFKNTSTVTWINIDGIHDIGTIEKIGANFDIHHLALEDILNTSQRPKYEDFDKYIFVVLKMLYFTGKNNNIESEQVSIIVGNNYVISFQEREGDVFNAVRQRIRNQKGRIRNMGADYLCYSLIDAVVDNYFLILETFGEQAEQIEEDLVSAPDARKLQIIQTIKRNVIFLRKSVWPLREVINSMQKSGSRVIKSSTEKYLADVYDHTIQIIDTIESIRDSASSMLDIYISSMSNKMNEVMKVLTIIATIFIPLTFIAGIYGMNFSAQNSPYNMPELNWRFGYFFALAIMALIAFAMVMFFKRKKWL